MEVDCDDKQESWRTIYMIVQEGSSILRSHACTRTQATSKVMVEWEDISTTIYKTLPTIAADDPWIDCDPLATTGNDRALFLEKQKLYFAVLMKCVKTDIVKTFAHLHQDTSDAQLVWKKLMEHATSSASTELSIVELQHLLANSKIYFRWHGIAKGSPLLGWQC